MAFVLLYFLAFNNREDTVSQARFDSLLVETRTIKQKMDSLRYITDSLRGLRSEAAPSCRSVGLMDSYLFSATVESRDRYTINDSTYSLQGIRDRFSDALVSADNVGCVHQIDVRPKPDQPSSIFVAAANRLRELFYVRVLNPR